MIEHISDVLTLEKNSAPGETKWRFFLYSESAWKAMYEACERATRRIDFEQFIFLPDTIGTQFAELLVKKAKEGIKVRLLADAGGSYAFFNSFLSRKLLEAGVLVEFFNKISPLRLHNLRIWFFRNHRKILIVDGTIGFIGGVGIGDFLSGWRDTHMEITGEIVRELEHSFETMWKMTIKDKFIFFPDPQQTESGFALLTNAPHNRQRFIYRSFLKAIRGAKKYVYITTPYFVPDTRINRVLRLVAKRGVEVRIMIPENSDHPYVDWASHFHFDKALRSGIRIFRYSTMLHSKSIAIDDTWATIGSANMDNYSFFFNYEANIVSINKTFAEEIRVHFENDMLKAKELTRDNWKKRGWHQKILEILSTPFARFF